MSGGLDKWGIPLGPGGGGAGGGLDKWGVPIQPSPSPPGSVELAGHQVTLHQGGGSLLGNLWGDVASTVRSVGPALVNLGHQVAYDSSHYPVSLNPVTDWHELQRAWDDPHSLAGGNLHPAATQLGYQYGPLAQGNVGTFYQRFHAHPFGPILDVATILTGGEGAVVRGGRLAERAGAGGSALARAGRAVEAAREPRLVGAPGVRAFHAPSSPNVLARIAQHRYDAFTRTRVAEATQHIPFFPSIGIDARSARALAREARVQKGQYAQLRGAFNRSVQSLKPAEKLALWFRRQGIHPGDYADLLRETEKRYGAAIASGDERVKGVLGPSSERRQQIIKAVSNPELAKVVESAPSPALAEAESLLGQMGTRSERAIQQLGLLPADVLTARRGLGAATLREDLGRDLRAVHPSAGLPEYVPHIGPPLPRGGATSGRAAPTGLLRTGGFDRLNRQVRFRTGNLILHPEQFGLDYARKTGLQVMRWWQEELHNAPGVEKPLDVNAIDRGGLNSGHVYFRANPSEVRAGVPRRTTPSISRTTKEEESYHASDVGREEQALLDAYAADRHVEEAASGVVFSELPPEVRRLSVSQLKEKGITQIPKAYADAFTNEFKAAAHNGATSVFDNTNKVWRTLLLVGRPAWATYNIVSQHLLYGLHYAGFGGLVAYAKAVRDVLGEPAFAKLRAYTRRGIPASRRQMALDAIDSVMPNLRIGGHAHSYQDATGGLYDLTRRGQLKTTGTLTLPGGHAAELGFAGRAVYQIARAPLKPFEVFGRIVRKANETLADDLTRVAAAHTELDKTISRARIQGLLDGVDTANKTAIQLLQALKAKDERAALDLGQQVVDQVNRAVGDFSNLSPFERRVIRRFVAPFYTWFKTVTQIQTRLFRDYPGRTRTLMLMGQAARQNNADLNIPMPSWLQDYLPLGGSTPQTQNVLSLNALNPLETPIQLGEAVRGALPQRFGGTGQPTAFGTDSPISLLGPWPTAALAAAGIDPFFGGTYRGVGSKQGTIARAFGQFATDNPEYLLAQELLGGRHLGPVTMPQHTSTLYPTQSRLDYLLNYLGYPIKRVNRTQAARLAAEGR